MHTLPQKALFFNITPSNIHPYLYFFSSYFLPSLIPFNLIFHHTSFIPSSHLSFVFCFCMRLYCLFQGCACVSFLVCSLVFFSFFSSFSFFPSFLRCTFPPSFLPSLNPCSTLQHQFSPTTSTCTPVLLKFFVSPFSIAFYLHWVDLSVLNSSL